MLERLRANVRLEYCPDRKLLPALLGPSGADLPREPYAEPVALLGTRPRPACRSPSASGSRSVANGRGHLGPAHPPDLDARTRQQHPLREPPAGADRPGVGGDVRGSRRLLRAQTTALRPGAHRSYLPTVLTADPPRLADGIQNQELRYTYGMRLRSYFGVDQVDGHHRQAGPRARLAFGGGVALGPKRDHVVGGSPCLNHIWARIVDGTAYLTAVIRSNDMYKAWPENAFALRALQAMIAPRSSRTTGESFRLGELIILSQSAHIYDDDWDSAAARARAAVPRDRAAAARASRSPRQLRHRAGRGRDPRRAHRRVGRAPSLLLRRFGGEPHPRAGGRRRRQHGRALAVHGSRAQRPKIALRWPDQFSYTQDRALTGRIDRARATRPSRSVLQRIASESHSLVVERDDVLRRHVGLDVVHVVDHVAAAGPEVRDAPSHLGADVVRRALRHHRLRVDRAPEAEPVAESGLQRRGVHVRRRHLDGVQHVDADLDQIVDQLDDRTAGVVSSLAPVSECTSSKSFAWRGLSSRRYIAGETIGRTARRYRRRTSSRRCTCPPRAARSPSSRAEPPGCDPSPGRAGRDRLRGR